MVQHRLDKNRGRTAPGSDSLDRSAQLEFHQDVFGHRYACIEIHRRNTHRYAGTRSHIKHHRNIFPTWKTSTASAHAVASWTTTAMAVFLPPISFACSATVTMHGV